MVATSVLDASAVLAFLHEEPGADIVEPLLPTAVICAVNWIEVLQRFAAADLAVGARAMAIGSFGIAPLAFTPTQAEIAADLLSPPAISASPSPTGPASPSRSTLEPAP